MARGNDITNSGMQDEINDIEIYLLVEVTMIIDALMNNNWTHDDLLTE